MDRLVILETAMQQIEVMRPPGRVADTERDSQRALSYRILVDA